MLGICPTSFSLPGESLRSGAHFIWGEEQRRNIKNPDTDCSDVYACRYVFLRNPYICPSNLQWLTLCSRPSRCRKKKNVFVHSYPFNIQHKRNPGSTSQLGEMGVVREEAVVCKVRSSMGRSCRVQLPMSVYSFRKSDFDGYFNHGTQFCSINNQTQAAKNIHGYKHVWIKPCLGKHIAEAENSSGRICSAGSLFKYMAKM